MAENTSESSTTVLVLAWLLVGVPLGWGVYNTVRNSQKLFQTAPAQATAPASQAR
jgi:hypothetical protein